MRSKDHPRLCPIIGAEIANDPCSTETDFPYCGTVRFFGSVSAYICDNTRESFTMDALTNYFGGDARQYSQVALLLSDGALYITSSTPTTSTTPISTGPTTTTPLPPPTPTPPVPPPHPNIIPATVGGAIGGAAILILGALGVFFMMRRRKRSANDIQPEVVQHMQQRHSSQMGILPPGGGTNHSTHNLEHPSPGQQQQQMYGFSPDKGVFSTTPAQQQAVPAYPGPVSPMTETGRMSLSMPPASPSTVLDGSSFQFSHHRGSSFGDAGGVPPTVLEAGGEPVGAAMVPGANTNHHGQFYEMS